MYFYLLAGIAAGLIVGIIGILIVVFAIPKRSSGTVIVYISGDPSEPPYLGFKLNESTYDVLKKRRVLFDVELTHLNSQN